MSATLRLARIPNAESTASARILFVIDMFDAERADENARFVPFTKAADL
jgi:hypothetical protein